MGSRLVLTNLYFLLHIFTAITFSALFEQHATITAVGIIGTFHQLNSCPFTHAIMYLNGATLNTQAIQ